MVTQSFVLNFQVGLFSTRDCVIKNPNIVESTSTKEGNREILPKLFHYNLLKVSSIDRFAVNSIGTERDRSGFSWTLDF